MPTASAINSPRRRLPLRICARLAKAEAKLAGGPAPESGLEMLWAEAPPIARTRSSKRECRIEWQRIHPGDRPPVRTLLDAMRAWKRCPEWRKDGNAFVPGLHRWIRNRQWENLPEDPQSVTRPRPPSKPALPADPSEIATPEDILAILRGTRMKS